MEYLRDTTKTLEWDPKFERHWIQSRCLYYMIARSCTLMRSELTLLRTYRKLKAVSPAVIAIPAAESLCPILYRYSAPITPPYDHPWRFSDLLLPSVLFGRLRLLSVSYSFPYFLSSRLTAGKRSGLTILRSCFGWETIVNGCGGGGGPLFLHDVFLAVELA
jgi:hypothetical protein